MTRLSYFLMYLGIFIIISTNLINISINNTVMNSSFGINKVCVHVKEKNSQAYFTRNNIKDLKKELKTQNISYSAKFDWFAAYNGSSYKARITGVDCRYSQFNDIRIKYGSFFTPADDNKRANTVIIRSDFSLGIFNTDKVVGKEISIFGKDFKIIGVYEHHGSRDTNGTTDKNMIETLSDDGIPYIYIPVDTFMQYVNTPGTDSLMINTGCSGIFDDKVDRIKTAIQGLGKNAENYKITDFNKTGILSRQLPQLFIFIMGCCILLHVLSFTKRRLILLIKKLGNGSAEYYFLSALKNCKRELISMVLLVIVTLALVTGLWKTVSFDLYIPPEYIPEEITDFIYISDSIKAKIIQHNQEAGLVPDNTERKAEISLKMCELLFFIGLLTGLTAIYISFIQLKYLKKSPELIALNCFLCVVLSVLVSFITVRSVGLDFSLDIKFITVFCLLLMCLILNMASGFYNKKNEERIVDYD